MQKITISDRKFSLYLFQIIIAGFLLLPFSLNAQSNITVVNPSFEKPDSGKIKGFDGKCLDPAWTGSHVDVPGWLSDKNAWDSGVEKDSPSDGLYRAFLMGGDTSIYQIPGKRLHEGDMIKLSVDAKNIYLAPSLKMELFYLLDGKNAKNTIISEVKTITATMAEYSISFKASDFPAAIGKRLCILFDNVSDSASWIGIDNVKLTNSDPRIIDVANYSFEQPDSGKVKGWDGVCSDSAYTGKLADIPNWQSDSNAFDSGVELGQTPTDGLYTGFMMATDTSMYQITDYTIQTGDIIEVSADLRITYAANLARIGIFYTNISQEKVDMGSEDFTLTSDNLYKTYAFSVNANDFTGSIGNKLGIYLDNVSTTGQSWAGMDNIRIINNNPAIVGVNDPVISPDKYSLAQNYPNPFNPSTNISYTLAKQGNVRLTVYDLLGREAAVLVNEQQQAGSHNIPFKANNLSSGIYFYSLQTADGVMTKKMTLLK